MRDHAAKNITYCADIAARIGPTWSRGLRRPCRKAQTAVQVSSYRVYSRTRPNIPPLRVIMYRKLVIRQAPSYLLAGLFFSMLVTFVAFDLDASRQEAFLRYEDDCRADAIRACPDHPTSNIRVFRGL